MGHGPGVITEVAFTEVAFTTVPFVAVVPFMAVVPSVIHCKVQQVVFIFGRFALGHGPDVIVALSGWDVYHSKSHGGNKRPYSGLQKGKKCDHAPTDTPIR